MVEIVCISLVGRILRGKLQEAHDGSIPSIQFTFSGTHVSYFPRNLELTYRFFAQSPWSKDAS